MYTSESHRSFAPYPPLPKHPHKIQPIPRIYSPRVTTPGPRQQKKTQPKKEKPPGIKPPKKKKKRKVCAVMYGYVRLCYVRPWKYVSSSSSCIIRHHPSIPPGSYAPKQNTKRKAPPRVKAQKRESKKKRTFHQAKPTVSNPVPCPRSSSSNIGRRPTP
jgi:hypothetical protein